MIMDDDHFLIDELPPPECSFLSSHIESACTPIEEEEASDIRSTHLSPSSRRNYHEKENSDNMNLNRSRSHSSSFRMKNRRSYQSKNKSSSPSRDDNDNNCSDHDHACSNRSGRSIFNLEYSAHDTLNISKEERRSKGFSTTQSYSVSRRSQRNNDIGIYRFDDISSLHCDEYGYDRKPQKNRQRSSPSRRSRKSKKNSIHSRDDEDDYDTDASTDTSVSDFFQAPTQKELCDELFKLVTPTTSVADALHCLSKLRQWGFVADNNTTTTKYLVEFQAVPSIVSFIKAVVEQRRALKISYLEKLEEAQQIARWEEKDSSAGFQTFKQHQRDFVDASNNHELCLHQALLVLHYYATVGNDVSSKTSRHRTKVLKAKVLKKALLAQLVETDGIQLLVGILEKELYYGFSTTTPSSPMMTDHHYGHSIGSSIWKILMAVGSCEHAVQLLKTQNHRRHGAKTLVKGIVLGLDHRMAAAATAKEHKDSTTTLRPIMNDENETSWMEDLFVTLCRLSGSKDAEDDVNNKEHDEIRFTLLDECVVEKCLRVLVDEPHNGVFGKNEFVTTLALSFFYACVRFGQTRYIVPKDTNETNFVPFSLGYYRLSYFVRKSLQSFPDHYLIKGTGSLILERIPLQYQHNKFGKQYGGNFDAYSEFSPTCIANLCQRKPLSKSSSSSSFQSCFDGLLPSTAHKLGGSTKNCDPLESYVSELVEPFKVVYSPVV